MGMSTGVTGTIQNQAIADALVLRPSLKRELAEAIAKQIQKNVPMNQADVDALQAVLIKHCELMARYVSATDEVPHHLAVSLGVMFGADMHTDFPEAIRWVDPSNLQGYLDDASLSKEMAVETAFYLIDNPRSPDHQWAGTLEEALEELAKRRKSADSLELQIRGEEFTQSPEYRFSQQIAQLALYIQKLGSIRSDGPELREALSDALKSLTGLTTVVLMLQPGDGSVKILEEALALVYKHAIEGSPENELFINLAKARAEVEKIKAQRMPIRLALAPTSEGGEEG